MFITLSISLNVFLAVRCKAMAAEVCYVNSGQMTTPADWNTFIKALAWVESRWDDNAESPKKAVGYLQITPILVDDANRIVGQDRFTLEGRRNREESILLFQVIMDNYNPQHDMQYALKLWNPYAKTSYHRAVMKKYYELISQEQFTHSI